MNSERIFYTLVVGVTVLFAGVVRGVWQDGEVEAPRYFSLAVPVSYEDLAGREKRLSLEDLVRKPDMRAPIDTLPMGPSLPETLQQEQQPTPETEQAERDAILDAEATIEPVPEWPTVVVAINHSPPRKIVAGAQIGGIDAAILREFAQRAKVNLEYQSCGFNDCLGALKGGEADLMTGLAQTDERQSYLTYLNPQIPFSSSINFYLKADEGFSLTSYRDLAGKRIGFLENEAYFAQFDRDEELQKSGFASESDMVNALLFNQIDAFIGDSFRTDYFLSLEGLDKRVAKAEYHVAENVMLYFLVMSKKSSHQDKADTWQQILAQMVLEGEVEAIIDRFHQRFAVAKWGQTEGETERESNP